MVVSTEAKEGLGWGLVDVRINIGHHGRILLIDTGVMSLSNKTVLFFCSLVQVPVEKGGAMDPLR